MKFDKDQLVWTVNQISKGKFVTKECIFDKYVPKREGSIYNFVNVYCKENNQLEIWEEKYVFSTLKDAQQDALQLSLR